ncbi:hypothetical protein [Streptosporangium carneum]|uniref:Uncharacterized protein n=1 Tax=Streptosporangium carneum TaxID=47481 RepID=A0A9W6IAC8_9ACTN|nr:hypothetical protein [Streptosporangium carneum]GLK15031.1 hypothetical protein GCM10017600_84440 [Streptosporangium carneum]
MTLTRTLTGLAMTAAVLTAVAPSAAHATTGSQETATTAVQWGPYDSPGHGARAAGSLKALGEDHAVIPAAATARISGRLQDLTRKSSTCGWAVFRITYRTKDGNLPFKHHSVRNCSYGTPKPFTFTYRDVYQVELKVCSEGKAAKPSLNCLYAESWKVVYLSK